VIHERKVRVKIVLETEKGPFQLGKEPSTDADGQQAVLLSRGRLCRFPQNPLAGRREGRTLVGRTARRMMLIMEWWRVVRRLLTANYIIYEEKSNEFLVCLPGNFGLPRRRGTARSIQADMDSSISCRSSRRALHTLS
jgi:hypothetical protein